MEKRGDYGRGCEQKGDEGFACLTARPKSFFMLPHYNKHVDDTEVEAEWGTI